MKRPVLWLVGGGVVLAGAIQAYQYRFQQLHAQTPQVRTVEYQRDWTPQDTSTKVSENKNADLVNYRSAKGSMGETLPPTKPIDKQAASYHLSLKGNHQLCGGLYKKGYMLDKEKGKPGQKEAMDTLAFLYDACVMYEADSRVYNYYTQKEHLVPVDILTERLGNQLVGSPKSFDHYPTSLEQRLKEVKSAPEFQKLKRGEQAIGRPFHQVLSDNANWDNIHDHFFYNADKK